MLLDSDIIVPDISIRRINLFRLFKKIVVLNLYLMSFHRFVTPNHIVLNFVLLNRE